MFQLQQSMFMKILTEFIEVHIVSQSKVLTEKWLLFEYYHRSVGTKWARACTRSKNKLSTNINWQGFLERLFLD